MNKALDELYSDGSFDKFVDENLDGGQGVEKDTVGDLSFVE